MNLKRTLFFFTIVCIQASACSNLGVAGGHNSTQKASTHSDALTYFPLAVGSKWTYSCSVEGEHLFDKTVTIVAEEMSAEGKYYRAELLVGTDLKAMPLYYSLNKDGDVFQSTVKRLDGRQLIMTARPAIGDSIGGLKVAGEEEMDIPVLSKILVIRLENFSLEDPGLSEEQRLDWEGKFYTRGVGLVSEADGIGGECVLIQFDNNSAR